MRNVTGTLRPCVLPGEIEIARPKNALIFTRFYVRRCRAGAARRRGSALNFSAGVLFIGGVGITQNHVRLPWRPRRDHPSSHRHFYGRTGIRVERYSSFSLAESLGGGACVGCRCDFLRGGPLVGPCVLRILILRVPVYHMSRVNSRCSAVLSNDMNIETLDVNTRRTKRSFSQ